MTDPSPTEKWLRIGVDGGASKTDLILTDAEGRILIEKTGPGCSPSHLGQDGARVLISRQLRDLITGRPGIRARITHTLLFMAGDPAFWRDYAVNLEGYGRVEADLDSVPALQLACGNGPGLAIHGGTGSFVAAREPDGRHHYAGGLGWRIGDPGSAHDLGVRAARRTLMEMDGWSAPSPVGTSVNETIGKSTRRDLLERLYTANDPSSLLAGLAPAISRLAEEGCREAATIMAESLQPLVDLAHRVAGQLALPPGFACGLSGRLFSNPVAVRIVTDQLNRAGLDCRISRITEEPIEGVRQILAGWKS